jgi:predicted nucleic acid-binding protein
MPEKARLVVVNTTPIIVLSLIGKLDLLHLLYGQVVAPPSVQAEVLALALELNADLVIVDERLARLHAKRLGLTLTGSLGVLLRAKQLGHVKAVAPLIRRLRQGGIHLSDMVVAQVLALADEI